MIKRIFWDLDECLLHSAFGGPAPGAAKSYTLGDGYTYHTICRPVAKQVIEFSRDLIGKENVFVLTTSTEEYAKNINRLFDFGFSEDQIFHRADIRGHSQSYPGAYGATHTFFKEHALADIENVLIDNLPPRENEEKCSMMGIKDKDRYLQIQDYYGKNLGNDSFVADVKEFLLRHHASRPY
jgi:hypothetical protein